MTVGKKVGRPEETPLGLDCGLPIGADDGVNDGVWLSDSEGRAVGDALGASDGLALSNLLELYIQSEMHDRGGSDGDKLTL